MGLIELVVDRSAATMISSMMRSTNFHHLKTWKACSATGTHNSIVAFPEAWALPARFMLGESSSRRVVEMSMFGVFLLQELGHAINHFFG